MDDEEGNGIYGTDFCISVRSILLVGFSLAVIGFGLIYLLTN